MQNHAFNMDLVRGFGRSPALPPPALPVSTETRTTEGVGEQPGEQTREPTGVGAAVGRGIQLVGPRQCRQWHLAYVEGGRPIVSVAGSGFSYQRALETIRAPQFFTFTGSGGTFLFASDVVNGRRCLKICVDGLRVMHTPGASTQWTVSHGRTGVGEAPGTGLMFPTQNFTPFFLRPVGTDPTGSTYDSYLQVFPNDPAGVRSGTNLGDAWSPGQIGTLINHITALWPKTTSGEPITKSGLLFLTYHDPTSGAPQTQGLPPGMALYRFRYDAHGNPVLAILSPEGFSLPNAPSPAPIVTQSAATSTSPIWTQAAWMVLNSQQQTPPGGLPPGVTTNGTWVWDPQQGGRWVWYPQDGTFAQINGYWVYGDSRAFQAPNIWQAVPMPTTSPDGTAGTWTQVHAGYWVWTPGAAPTSYTWVWWLLGIAAVGGVGYVLLD
jgi:hypothetical protein